jgi:hypothetical protein
MAITKTTHPPGGATAMFAICEPGLTSLGWYYVPAIMLWAIVAVATGLVTNNIQRRYPVFWFTPTKLLRPKEDLEEEREIRAADGECDLRNSIESDETNETDGVLAKENFVVISGAGITIPDSLCLSSQQKQAVEEIQRLLEALEATERPVRQPQQVVWLEETRKEQFYRGTTWDVDIV